MKTRIRYKESHDVGCDQEIMIGHDRNEKVVNDEQVKIGNNRKVRVDNNDSLDVGNELTITAMSKITIKCGASSIVMDPGSIEVKSPMITISADATAKLSSPMTTVEGTGLLTLTGGLVKIN
jgi:type VI secretion system secreted protein VgrG